MIKQQYYFHAHLKPFVKPYLKKLKKANIKICIATATDYKLAQAALKRLEIADYFDFIITCDQIGKGKEYPDIYLYAAKKLCLPISEIAVFEDSLHAIITAKKAGFQVIGVYDESSKEDKEKIIKIADGFINSYTDGGFTYEKGVNDSRL